MEGFRPTPALRLLDQYREVLRFHHFSYRTEQTFYGAGLRLMEALRLRVKDVDFHRGQIVVHDGKGAKDRVTVLPQSDKVTGSTFDSTP